MWCRQCDFRGDAIEYVMRRDGCDFRAACDTLGLALDAQPKRFVSRQPGRRDNGYQRQPVNLAGKDWVGLKDFNWQAAASTFVDRCFSLVEHVKPESAAARDYLENKRRLGVHTTDSHRIGFNPHSHKAQWGPVEVWLPAGIVIPWVIDGAIWRVNIRRLDGSEPKYISPKGWANGLFNADKLKPGCTAVLVEGEFDALTIEQEQPHPIKYVPVATGSTGGSRIYRWVGKLALCSSVIVAFDGDEPGEQAAAWWLDALPRAIRKRPTQHDVSDMLSTGEDIHAWLQSHL